jgi:hypothetical protein
MSFRTFKITLPADTNNHNLYSLIVGQVSSSNIGGYGLAQGGTNETGIMGAIPSFGILSDRGDFMEIQADSANSSTLTVNDSNYANTTGKVLNAGDVFSLAVSRNSICFKDYYLQGGASSQALEVRLENI